MLLYKLTFSCRLASATVRVRYVPQYRFKQIANSEVFEGVCWWRLLRQSVESSGTCNIVLTAQELLRLSLDVIIARWSVRALASRPTSPVYGSSWNLPAVREPKAFILSLRNNWTLSTFAVMSSYSIRSSTDFTTTHDIRWVIMHMTDSSGNFRFRKIVMQGLQTQDSHWSVYLFILRVSCTSL
jgi:hypothetical protein